MSRYSESETMELKETYTDTNIKEIVSPKDATSFLVQ